MAKTTARDEPPAAVAVTVETTTSSSVAGDSVYRCSAALSTWLAGVSQACASSFSELSDRLTPDNTMRMGTQNGFVEGFAAGNARFFDEMAKASRNAFDALAKPTVSETVCVVDYERLSKMVAEELRKTQ